MENTILKAEMLSKTYSNGSIMQHVLKNLNIEIKEGDFTVIMGSSGSGKSTLLYALSGMDKPTLGKIDFKGETISKYSNDKLAVFRRKHCGFVFQQIYLNDTMSVLDNIMISGLLVSRDKKAIATRTKALLQQVGITESSYAKYPSQLSGGEAQRVAIVRALINAPAIVFADEPTGALNSTNAINVLDVMTEVNASGQSIIMVTHDIKTARRANRILYLKDGVIIDELSLGRYVKDEPERHKRLREFLESMGW
ncbi:ABC transporter ATP-binding protein [Acetobacterium woodii]|uniref:ABC transport system ATP-binding protein n=1 Tax=Acetobacterium woodii (strain ATCC 29683 / DSM 1030 / JCM 2381 / KCTC 1655 / WB1) TaxID=931626 RepID=H6LFM5_ACEWD|nr:ABC transporter ATP-binding protein [Acetobacterium woodii]AFA46970.1 ABC transport system ATP-binding protein [Acetobacterium woodii DSM 1030]